MKKLFKILVPIAVAASVAFCSSACGQDSANSSKENSTVSSSVSSEESSKNESSDEESSKNESSSEENSGVESSNDLSDLTGGESSLTIEQSYQSSETSKLELSLPEEHVLQYIFSLDQTKQGISAIEKNFSNDNMEVKVEVEDDNTVVMNCNLKKQLDDSTGMYSQKFAEADKSGEDNFNNFVDGLKELSHMDFIVFIVRYNNADGTIIYQDMYFGGSSYEDSDSEESYEFSSDLEESSSLLNENGHYNSLEDFLADPDLKSYIDSQMETYSKSGFIVDLYAENENILVYEFRKADGDYTDAEIARIRSKVEEAEFGQTFSRIATSVQNAVDVDGIKISVRYKNFDGSIVAQREYEPSIST